MRVLASNSGSTSLKLCLFELDDQHWKALHTGTIELTDQDGSETLREFLDPIGKPDVIIHRVVHAGAVSEALAVIDTALIAKIRHWSVLAPGHNQAVLQQIDWCHRLLPTSEQFAAFDSGLYHELPQVARMYALPAALSPAWPIQRYGFHGLAHRNQWRQVKQSLPRERHADLRLISLQLGGGCSWTAWRGAQVLDTSMGFTPLEGLVMGRRSGSIDPGIVLHLQQQENLSVDQVHTLISQQGGLMATGSSDDMRVLLASDNAASTTALAHYCYQVRKAIGAAMAVLGGVDAISFGGGVGEHSAQIRQGILAGLENFGIQLDSDLNSQASGAGRLHADTSKTALYLTPVNEMNEMMRQYQAFLNSSS
ncbi:MAG: hypothetical protein RQ757_04000 [Pseudomonadales bacterium]|nr:hypothetical protein [Pseudomonadales bacterium]